MRQTLLIANAVLLCLAVATASAADRYDPRLRFRTTRTANFDIHAHQGEEAMVRRLADIAERVRAELEPVLGRPRGRVHVILVDQTDLSNGWATPVPYNTIEIAAVPPPPESLIGNTTDWLEIVFSHEYTHILHLDRTRGVMQGVRRIFGRVPVAFPNAFLPMWQIEGLATYQESRMTGQGRVPAGDFRALVDVAAAQGRFESRDRVSGGLTDWPDGNGAYAYGAYFHQFLADRYGPERISRLADASAGRVPLFGSGAFKKVFGRSEGELWNEFRAARSSVKAPASDTDARATRLTHHGFMVSAVDVAEDGSIYYATTNADRFPALMRLEKGGTPKSLGPRVLGGRTSVRGDWIVFDQLERVRSVALYSDLYARRTDGRDTRRLTRDARAADPDLSPDARTIVCTVQATGRRAIGLLEFSPDRQAQTRMLVDDPDADFAGPRWSPDGRQIVAGRRRAAAFELVLIDPASGAIRVLLSHASARLVTPSWSADGQSVLFSADPDKGPFNVFAVDIAGGAVRRVTDTLGGAQYPAIAPDGSLVYVGYTVQGSDLFSVPYNPSAQYTWPDASGVKAGEISSLKAEPSSLKAGAIYSGGYNPLRTLVPTYWVPTVESDAGELVVGAGTGMADALGRHAYLVNAGWATSRARPDWNVAYAYDRWRPTLVASYSDDTDPVQGGEVRSRELFAGALLAFRRVRYSNTFLAGFDAQTDTLTCEGGCGSRVTEGNLRSLRGGWLFDSRRQFGYSISAEEGIALEIAAEASPESLGSDGDAGAAIVDLRGFRRIGAGHTVLAARAGIAASWGDESSRRIFSAAGPGPSYPIFDFGRDTIALLRGFDPDDIVGTRAASVNVDLRVPLARPQRGPGSWPVFLHSIHAAAFVDVGHAWDGGFHVADVKSSVGGELSADVVVLHFVPVTVAGGAAWTHDAASGRQRGALFARLGYAF